MLHTLPDLAGDNAVHNLGDLAVAAGFTLAPLDARSVGVVATGAGVARLGDSATASNRGIPISAPFGSQFLPYVGEQCMYTLGGLYVYVPVGCTVSVAWEY